MLVFELLLMLSGVLQPILAAEDDNLIMRYYSPAKVWEATLPLGNGRLGMMPDGDIDSENIILNDITMWSGSEDDALNPESINYLPQIRKLLAEGKNPEAQKIMYEHFRCKGSGSAFGSGKDAPYGCFQLLGNLKITYNYPEKIKSESESGYEFGLNLNNAIAYTHFKKNGIKFSREYFVSHDQDVMIIRINADKRKSVSFSLDLSRSERGNVTVKDKALYMEGQLNDGLKTDKGIRYKTKLQIVNKGGKLGFEKKSLSVKNADETLIIISTATDFEDKNYQSSVDNLLRIALKTPYNKLKENHIRKYQEKFSRVSLNLGDNANVNLPTDERLNEFQQNDDPAFAALYFQFGRYLMISGTRTGSMPLNLQGLWANSVQTPWNGDYHLNINVQMNYWPAEVCNLSELQKPLIDFTQSLVPSGEATARTFYNADGWVAHVITNPWHFTAPAEHASWGATNTGGAWLCEHLWEHYSFTRDKDYLKTVYPTLLGAAKFFLTNMIAEPKHGWLVTAPSSSPENAFYMNESNEPVYVCMGPTMDVQIIRELFNNVLLASEILGINDQTITQIRETLPQLPPMQISKEGYLQEWLEDYKEADPHHRHVSHLYGLYPSNQISISRTPELADAARVTLNRRGDEGTGWSRAWKVNFWARLHDGNRSYKLLKNLLVPAFKDNDYTLNAGSGTYPNLFCAHPPFQIDGNLGGTAGIAEMLIQSQDGYIELLPALPDTWQKGEFKGLRVRGGAEVNVSWENRKITHVVIKATANNTFKLKVPDYVPGISSNGKKLVVKNGFIELKMIKGETNDLNFSL